MPKRFRATDAIKYASRVGLYKNRGAKINGRPAHIVVAERKASGDLTAIEETTNVPATD